ncbi:MULTISPECIES: hypothetical protein [unclassified Arthrobacter]|uniref:hypothetical protein n=1 Tax=Arthrobacter sp. Bz4 TaxID=2171979 RepID=UPI001ED9AC1A|nr:MULTISPECIES: hypothetical protein [unclassified Arthrobacter]
MLQGSRRLFDPEIPVLDQFSAPQVNVTSPILRIDHQHPAGPNNYVVEVGFRSPRPAQIVKHKPAMAFKQVKAVCYQQLPSSPSVPGPVRPFGMPKLTLQPSHGFSSLRQLILKAHHPL